MADGTPERSISDAQAWIDELRHTLSIDRHRRVVKAALSDVWTAVQLTREHSIQHLRRTDRVRAGALQNWWKSRVNNLRASDPALGWVWAQRNIAQHQGDDVAVWTWDIHFEGETKVGDRWDARLGIDPWGNVTVNGALLGETSDAFPGARITVEKSVIGASVPSAYEESFIPDLLSDALESARSLLLEVRRDWS